MKAHVGKDVAEYVTRVTKNIPDRMKAAERWLLWKELPGTKKPRKVPFYASGKKRHGDLDSVEDVSCLTTFDEACGAYASGKYKGLGFALGPVNPSSENTEYWQGVDLDHLSEHASLNAIKDQILGYVETSPSGDGVHAIGVGDKFTALASNESGIEAYSYGRFFTVTGIAIRGKPEDLSQFVARRLLPIHEAADKKKKEIKAKAPVVQSKVKLNGKPKDNGSGGYSLESFFAKVNTKALGKLSAWVPELLPKAYTYHDGYRIKSAQLGRDFEEDLSILPTGIKDFGEEKGKTPIDLVIDWSAVDNAKEAALWLCGRIGVDAAELGWNGSSNGKRNGAGRHFEEVPPPGDDDVPVELRGKASYTDEAVSVQPLAGDEGKTVQEFELNDIGNGKRIVYWHGEDIRYSHEWKKWLVWDGKRWAVDWTAQVYRFAKDTQRRIYHESRLFEGTDETQEDKRKAICKHANKSAGAQSILNMISMASSEPSVPVMANELDKDPWLLNCLNGIVDLRTGKLLKHDRNKLQTKMAEVEYDPDAHSELWDEFLFKIMDGDKDPAKAERLSSFLRRVIGYCLTGLFQEKILLVAYGTGDNGKSTFLNAIREMLGDYAKQAAMDLLVVKKFDAHPTEIADLAGRRFVCSIETEEGKKLAEALVKWLTGTDKISARRMHENFFEFDPTFKLWLATNHKPNVRMDKALWSRIKLIPFDVSIPEAEQDKKLASKLEKDRPGILRWAVQGCLEWKAGGLQIPKEIEQATAGYQAEMDVLANFLLERCKISEDISDGAYVTAKELYESYCNWAEENGERPLSKKSFGTRLYEKTGLLGRKGGAGTQMWDGISLIKTPVC